MAALSSKSVASTAFTKPAARVGSCRVKPFTAANSRSSKLPYRSNHVPRAADTETEAAPAPAAVEEPVVVEEDFTFNFSEAKKGNTYDQSDIEAALRFYTEGDGDLQYEADHVTNISNIEDAAFFDDIDNNEAYENDEFASAGIPEAAPKVKRGNQRQEELEGEGLSEEMQELENQKVTAAAFDELGLEDEFLEEEVRDAPWNWDQVVSASRLAFSAPKQQVCVSYVSSHIGG